MASILTVTVKGVSKSELDKNFQILDSYMNQQTEFTLVSSTKPNFNPRIYYSSETLITKIIHDVINVLKTDKIINQAVRGISYSQNLNKI
jgi:hypothetical protein